MPTDNQLDIFGRTPCYAYLSHFSDPLERLSKHKSMTLPHRDLSHILNHTRDLWEDLRDARLFITGGTGFFGHWLVESFLYANQQLNLKASASLLSRDPESAKQAFSHLLPNPSISILAGDMCNFEFPKGEYSHVIHAATDSSTRCPADDNLAMLNTIIGGTRHTLDFSVQCKAEKFLFTSSGAVYGKQPSTMTHIPEEYNGAPDALDAKSVYGSGKRTAELLCSLYTKQFSFTATIARCFTFVGPYLPLDVHFAVGNFIRDAMKGGPILIKGNGTPRRSYLYTADLTIWLWTILFRGEAGRAYNVGSDDDVSIEQLAHLVSDQFESKMEIRVLDTRESENPPEWYVPSIARSRHELGLDTWIPIREGIVRTVEFHRGEI